MKKIALILALIMIMTTAVCSPVLAVSGPLTNDALNTTGASWYKIDSHTHSAHSDGAGTVAQNLNQARRAGMDALALTDHGTSKGWPDAQAYMTGNSGILPVRGNEYTTSKGHAVVLNVDENINYNDYSWKDMIEKAQSMDALLYIAHPFETHAWKNGWDDAGYDGIEVWNNWGAPRHDYNARAFEKWDELNGKGRKHYGITDTDAHLVRLAGASWMSVYLTGSLTAGNLIEGMRAGHMYGSNGPHLEFTAAVNGDTAMMGDSLEVSQEGETVTFNIKGSYTDELSRLIIIKNGDVVETVPIGASSFDTNAALDVAPGDFVRVELEGLEANGKDFTMDYGAMRIDGKCAPFAFSNPIFFDQISPVSPVIENDWFFVTYNIL